MIKLKDLLEVDSIKKRLGGRYGGEPEDAIANPGNNEPALSAKKEIKEASKWQKGKDFIQKEKDSKMRQYLQRTFSALAPWLAGSALPNPSDSGLTGAAAHKAHGKQAELRKILSEATLADAGSGAKGKKAKVSVGFFHNGRSVNIGKTGTVVDLKRKFGGQWGSGGTVAVRIKFDDISGLNKPVWVQAANFKLNEAVADAADDVTPEDSEEIEKDLEKDVNFVTHSPKMFEADASFSPTNFPMPKLKDLANEILDAPKPAGEVQKKLLGALPRQGHSTQLTILARRPEFRGISFKRLMTAAGALNSKGLVKYSPQTGAIVIAHLQEASDKPITSYKGWPIFTLDHYTTLYYYAQQRKDPKTFKSVMGPIDHYPRIKTLERKIDKMLKKWGKESLGEGEESWGKDQGPAGKLTAKKITPKAVPEALGDFKDSDVQGVVNDEPLWLKDMVPQTK